MSSHHKIDWVAVAALVVSICALVTSVHEMRATREHNKLSFAPIPMVVFHSKGGGKAGVAEWPGWRLSNLGPGTALVKDVYLMRRDDEPAEAFPTACFAGPSTPFGWRQLLQTLEADPNFKLPGITYQIASRGLPIKSGDSITVMEFEPGEFAERLVAKHKERIVVRACVCSVYGDCSEVGSNVATPTECADQSKIPRCK